MFVCHKRLIPRTSTTILTLVNSSEMCSSRAYVLKVSTMYWIIKEPFSLCLKDTVSEEHRRQSRQTDLQNGKGITGYIVCREEQDTGRRRCGPGVLDKMEMKSFSLCSLIESSSRS